MVAPITNQTVYKNTPSTRYPGTFEELDTRVRYQQARPIDRVLAYYVNNLKSIQRLERGSASQGAGIHTHIAEPMLSQLKTNCVNKSYEKLKEQISSAGMGVNLVEYRQARDMITKRGLQLLELVYLLARRRYRSAGALIGASFYDGRPPRRATARKKWVLPDYTKKTNKAVSNLWLEWHFGVDPLIKDVHDAAKVLSDPLPQISVRGSAEEFGRASVKYDIDLANPGTWSIGTWATRCRHRQGANLAITNPNLSLAGQLGLLNPAELAWEIVPFSFVVDWFVNVGDWLQSFSDFAGMNLQFAYNTETQVTYHTKERFSVPFGGAGPWYHKDYGRVGTMYRKVGLASPILTVRTLKLPSLSRTATVWSLVSQIASRR